MKLQLNEVKFASAWDAEELGTLRSGLEAGDKVKFAKIKADKRITVLITEQGHEAPNKQVICSGPLDAIIRKAVDKGIRKATILNQIINLNVIKNKTGSFLVLPAGEIGESYTLDQLAEEAKKEENVNLQELIAF